MSQNIRNHQLDNGLVVIGQTMPWLESVAFSLSIPAGCLWDPADKIGVANFASEMVQRGCGSRDSRRFIEDLEYLGVDSSSSVTIAHTNIGGAMPSESLDESLGIFADVLLDPHIPEGQLEEGRMVCIQEAMAVEDDLAQRVMIELRDRHFPSPLGRSFHGTLDSIGRIEHSDIVRFHRERYVPEGTIVSIAGKFDWEHVLSLVDRLLGGWSTKTTDGFEVGHARGGNFHIDHESQQTHIGLAIPSLPFSHPDYLKARAAVGVLSDGMSSRLFHEVREKRGLCYTVYASHHSLKERGSIVCYSGTSADRAQETLEVIISELSRLADGISADELSRLKTQIKSGLIMQQESSRSRAGSLAGDWYHLGRVRTLNELLTKVDRLTVEEINSFLAENRLKDYNVVTLGKQSLEIPIAV